MMLDLRLTNLISALNTCFNEWRLWITVNFVGYVREQTKGVDVPRWTLLSSRRRLNWSAVGFSAQLRGFPKSVPPMAVWVRLHRKCDDPIDILPTFD